MREAVQVKACFSIPIFSSLLKVNATWNFLSINIALMKTDYLQRDLKKRGNAENYLFLSFKVQQCWDK